MQKILYILTILCLTIGNSLAKDRGVSSKDSLDSQQIAEYVKNGRNNLLRLIEGNAQNLKSNAPQYNKYVFTLEPEPNPTGEYSKEFVSTDVADINALNVKLRILNGELRNGNLPEIYIGVNGKLGVATYLRRVLEVGEVGNAYEGVDKNSKNLGGVTAIVANYKKIFTDIVASIGVGAGKLQPNKNNGILVISLGHDQTIVPKKGITLTPTDDFSDKSKIETQIGCFSGYDDRLWTPSVPQGQPDPKAKLKAEVLDNFDRYPSSNSKNDVTTKLEIFAERIKDGLTNSLAQVAVECPANFADLVTKTTQKRTAEFEKEVAAFAKAIDNQNSLFITDNTGFIDESDFLKYELPDKLQVLATGTIQTGAKVSEYKLTVIFNNVNFALPEGSGSLAGNEFAQKVFDASSKLKSCAKCILMVVPYIAINGTGPGGTDLCLTPGTFGMKSHGTAYMMPYVAGGSGVSFIGNMRSQLLAGNGFSFEKAVNGAFKEIPKMHTIFTGIILLDHTFSTTIKQSTGYVTTSDKIFEVNIYEDSRRKELADALDTYLSFPCISELCSIAKNETYENRVVEIQNMAETWDVFKKTNLKESLLNYKLAEDYVKWYATREQDFLSVFAAPDDSKFYAGKNEIQISDVILAFDVVDGIASVFNLDLITSSIGAIYCYNKGRMEEFAIYTASASLALIPGPNAVRVLKETYQKVATGVEKLAKTTRNTTVFVGAAIAEGRKFTPGVPNFLGAKLNSSVYTKAKSYASDDSFIKALEDGMMECEECVAKLNLTPAKVDQYKTSRNTNPNQTLKQFLFSVGDFFVDNIYKPAYEWLLSAEAGKGGLTRIGRKLKKGDTEIAEVTNEGAVKFMTGKYDPAFNSNATKIFDGDDNIVMLAPDGSQIKGGFGMNPTTGMCYGGNCFIAGTPVLTINGLVPIENIELGTKVASKNSFSGEITYKEVRTLFKKQTKQLVKIYANGEVINATPEHPFRVRNQWIVADRLKAGDQLEVFANDLVASNAPFLARSSIEIDSLVRLDSVATVYNFEVEDFHTYFVGKTGYWVHNMCATQAVHILAHGGDRVAKDFLLNIARNFTTAQRLKLYEAMASLSPAELNFFLTDFNHAVNIGLVDDLKYVFGDTRNIVAMDDWKLFKTNPSNGQRERLVGTLGKHGDFTVNDLVNVRDHHLKTGPHQLKPFETSPGVTVDRIYPTDLANGVTGFHEMNAFWSIPNTTVSGALPPNNVNFGDTEYIFVQTRTNTSAIVPGTEQIYYHVPRRRTDGITTDGTIKEPGNKGKKTIYNASIWTDDKLDRAIQEAIIDYKMAGGRFSPTYSKGNAKTKEGFPIEFYHDRTGSGKITSWYFNP